MINENFIDGQLDECELTLQDLHIIAKSFVRILMGIYHQRVEYPKDEADRLAAEPARTETHEDKFVQSKPISQDTLRPTPPVSPKNIRRIGN